MIYKTAVRPIFTNMPDIRTEKTRARPLANVCKIITLRIIQGKTLRGKKHRKGNVKHN